MNEPDQIVAGTSYTWTEQWTSYPAPAWSLQYTINGPVKLQVSGVTLGSGFQITLTTTNTGTLVPGRYAYQAVATNGSQSVIASQGTMQVLAGLAGLAAGTDQRTDAQVILDAVSYTHLTLPTKA